MATRKTKAAVTPEISAYMAAISGRGKGGTARAKALSKTRRSEIAKKAAAARMTALTPERRSEIAKKAVAARESKRAVKSMTKAPRSARVKKAAATSAKVRSATVEK